MEVCHMTQVNDAAGSRELDLQPVPPSIFAKQDALGRALLGLILEAERLGLSGDDALNIVLGTVAQVV
jgi:hypothetical protein